MTKSALQIARAAYQPKLPKALKGAVKVKEGEPTQSVADQEAIKALFPNTYGMPLIQFVEGEAVNMPAINVGVILSGGQAPGGHNVISGLFDGIKALCDYLIFKKEVPRENFMPIDLLTKENIEFYSNK